MVSPEKALAEKIGVITGFYGKYSNIYFRKSKI
jgi:hypothetical protein